MSDKFIIKVLENKDGISLFEKWYYSIKDQQTRRKILLRLKRISQGNLGDWKSVGNKVFELRLDFGAGYRVYFSRYEDTVIILLAGGDKSTQQSDIKKAIQLWEDYRNEVEKFLRNF
ncbi:addiction module killer protein [Cyanobacterium stanieri PCC 7202]|uniref:Addiction module killer protein n=1 Tax=Cyanobacterium stanieri (strain ATCC 29140 / PCC 7202) TaxID=292563 RepID=K9YPH9_CYASC|nr:addiction module killer protein [Cyanobacterium stanieri PCC 7202]